MSPPPPSPWATWRCWTWTMRRSSCGFWGRDRLLSVAADGSDYETYSFGRSYLKGCHLGGDGFAVLLLGRYQAGGAEQVLTIDPQCQLIAQAPSGGRCSPSPPPGATCPCSPAAAWRSTPGTCPSTAPWRTPRTPASPPSPQRQRPAGRQPAGLALYPLLSSLFS